VTRKASSRTPVRKTISPLLSALSRSSPTGDANPLLLKAFIALDALAQGKGSRGLFAILGQQLVVSENLCAAGYAKESLRTVREAHAALVRVEWDARANDEWHAKGDDYVALRAAVAVLEAQLLMAPRLEILAAELAMTRTLMRPPANHR
jgi:hypothetical protein